ncbi:MAG: hypothetical protein Fur002_19390 [Anaerolineales bacterium]
MSDMNTRAKYAICINNKNYEASLIPRKIYEVVPDERAEKDDFIRVIDESGEDYLYHVSHFIFLQLPLEVEQALVVA